MPYGAGTEHLIIDALRRANALTLSLVAEEDGTVLGHVAFSPVTIEGAATEWYGLGPVAVAPGHQRAGIGSALIRTGLTELRALGAEGCVLVGSPAYYARFGFRHDARLTCDGAPPEVFQILAFGDRVPAGTVAFHPAFWVKA